MPLAEEMLFDRDRFSGRVRLFPLPNLVMFPHVMQPLHVFEPRYRDMLAEALETDGLIGMAVLKPGWETNYDGRPPLDATACLAKVVNYHRLEDGRHNVLLVGLKRIEIVRELPESKSFREAVVQVGDDRFDTARQADRPEMQERLVEGFRQLLPSFSQAESQLEQLLTQQAPLGLLTDVVSFTLNLPQDAKVALLRELNVDRRAAMLCEHLGRNAEGSAPNPLPVSPPRTPGGSFPPKFSDN
jgi:ATP-dependent Lon protease